MKAIKCENLTKKFKNINAVDGLNFEVEEGELFSLLGTNGAGKSTTIKMLCGLLKPTSGDAKIFDESILKEEFKKFVAVSPQETAVAKNLTVKENLLFMAKIYFDKTKAEEKTKEIIKEFSLEKVENQRAKTLSGGYQRRLSIAMAVISEPKLLFLDEPTLGLDVISMHELWDTITNLKKKSTIILTTHYMKEAEKLSDKIAIMKNGKIIALGTADELIKLSRKSDFEEAFIEISKENGGDIR
ncbi:MAG: ABC transporter ATP-binding protein [Clostridia bacterium]|nr:ABC transporter ATP-binding protein [Clostridia bacterium]